MTLWEWPKKVIAMQKRILKNVLLSFIIVVFLILSYLFYCIKIKSSTYYKEKVWKERIEMLKKGNS